MAIFMKNCIGCHTLFKGGEDDMCCKECLDLYREDWDKVRGFLHFHKDVKVGDVVEQTGVAEKVIRLFIKQEKIRVVG